MSNMDDRADDIMGSRLEAIEVLNQLDFALERAERCNYVFPLQTVQSLAERWGISRQAVSMRTKQDPIFPKPLTGIIEATKGGPKVFAMRDVERYEKEKGLRK